MHDKRNDMKALARAGANTLAALALGALLVPASQAQHHPVTAQQRAEAQQVAARGVPVSELAPNAPETYVVKRGDTLWGISGMYLQRPWRWPELWGMNLQQIANPHRIYPGQTLYLEKAEGYARLRTSPAGTAEAETVTVRVSPRTRYDSLADTALPTLKMHLIEPFLVQPLVVDEPTLAQAPRIVATRDERVIMASGDRAYVRGPQGNPLELEPGVSREYRVFRNVVALKDPDTGAVLGHEAQYLGRAELVRGEAIEPSPDGKEAEIVPATVDLSGAKEAMRPGDRLLPAPQRSFVSFVPHAPQLPVQASVVSIYGSDAVANAGQNQVVTINRGTQDGMDAGLVLQLRTRGERIKDKTDADRTMIRLPSEANGLAMVFLAFERVSYALILQTDRGVRVGDRLVNPE
ncbi:MAG: LysM peptidoglycan-binding domain-containing protein [Proteobacteria bacterium]|nr:LysM peptidoglycan-binding domain-containing protein [Pseudomonadota bacterium]